MTIKKIVLFVIEAFAVLSANAEYYSTTVNGIRYSLNSETRNAEVLGAFWQDDIELTPSGTLTIPAFVHKDGKEYYVTEIGYGAFSGFTELKWLDLPKTIQTIGEGAFRNCINLRFVNNLSNVMTTIKAYAFAGCVNLKGIFIPPSLATLGSCAFENCKSLSTIDLGGTLLVEIPFGLFRGCSTLRAIIIATGLIPGITGIRKIHDKAFEGCAFSIITLPRSLIYLGGEAFKGCSNLQIVQCLFDDPFRISYDTFDNYENIILEVPKGTWNDFKNVLYWNKFANFREIDIDEITNVNTPVVNKSQTSKAIMYFDTNGNKIDNPQRGINIMKYSDGTTKKVMMK